MTWTLVAMTFAEVTHAVVEVTFTIFLVFCAVLMVINARNIHALLLAGQQDRIAREQAILQLRQEAVELAKRAQEAKMAHETYLRELHEKIDRNTEMTQQAAHASSQAAEIANSMNEKIAQTNQRLLDRVDGTAKPLHDHIEEAVEIGKDVEKKVDVLVDDKRKEG